MTAAFVSIGAGVLALAWPLARAGGRWSRAVPPSLVVAGAGMVVSGIFRTDPGRSGALTDAVHSRASALATVALIGAALAWSLGRTRRVATWRRARRPRRRRSGASSPLLHRSSWTGVSQRLLWLTLLAWLIVTAVRLGSDVRRDVSGPSATTVTMGA